MAMFRNEMIRNISGGYLRFLIIEFFSSYLISGDVPVDQHVSLQVVLGHIGIIPSGHKILVKGM